MKTVTCGAKILPAGQLIRLSGPSATPARVPSPGGESPGDGWRTVIAGYPWHGIGGVPCSCQRFSILSMKENGRFSLPKRLPCLTVSMISKNPLAGEVAVRHEGGPACLAGNVMGFSRRDRLLPGHRSKTILRIQGNDEIRTDSESWAGP